MEFREFNTKLELSGKEELYMICSNPESYSFSSIFPVDVIKSNDIENDIVKYVVEYSEIFPEDLTVALPVINTNLGSLEDITRTWEISLQFSGTPLMWLQVNSRDEDCDDEIVEIFVVIKIT